jgi:hypothetical protein
MVNIHNHFPMKSYVAYKNMYHEIPFYFSSENFMSFLDQVNVNGILVTLLLISKSYLVYEVCNILSLQSNKCCNI